jgi:hypothetical protein
VVSGDVRGQDLVGRRPVCFSKAVSFFASRREGLSRRTISRIPVGQPVNSATW